MSSRKRHNDPYEYLSELSAEPTPAEKILQKIQEQNKEKQILLQETPAIQKKAGFIAPMPNNEIDYALYQEQISSQRAADDLNTLYHSNAESKRQDARNDIHNLITSWGLKYIENYQHYPLSRDEKHIIRMDYYGTIGKPDNTPTRCHFSSEYAQFVNHPYREKLPRQNYNLSFSPCWKIFRQFKRFRQIEPQLIEQLQAMDIPPALLPKMNAYDFSDVLYERFKKQTDDSNNAILFLGARRSFIKDFIRHNEKAFRQVMHYCGVDDRYTHELVKVMKAHGSTLNVFVIDHKKAANLLRYYMDKKILPSETVINKEISAEQINLIRSRGDYMKVAVLDDNGQPLTGPMLSIHHKIAVKDAGDKTYLAEVNDFENLCLTIGDPYHRVLHALDVTETIGRREKYKARIYMDNDLVFWGGFNPLFHIKYDYSKDIRTQRHKMNRFLWQQQQTEIDAEIARYNLLPEEHQNMPKEVSRKEKKQRKKISLKPQKEKTKPVGEKKRKPRRTPEEKALAAEQNGHAAAAKAEAKSQSLAKEIRSVQIRKIEANRNKHRYAGFKGLKKKKELGNLIDNVYQAALYKQQTISGIINSLLSGKEK